MAASVKKLGQKRLREAGVSLSVTVNIHQNGLQVFLQAFLEHSNTVKRTFRRLK